jgi:hypothetical protein
VGSTPSAARRSSSEQEVRAMLEECIADFLALLEQIEGAYVSLI